MPIGTTALFVMSSQSVTTFGFGPGVKPGVEIPHPLNVPVMPVSTGAGPCTVSPLNISNNGPLSSCVVIMALSVNGVLQFSSASPQNKLPVTSQVWVVSARHVTRPASTSTKTANTFTFHLRSSQFRDLAAGLTVCSILLTVVYRALEPDPRE